MKHSMRIMSMLCVLILASCGGSGGGGGSSSSEDRQEMQETEGAYRAIVRPLNYTISGWVPNGKIDIKIVDDSIEVRGWMDDSSNVTHIQNIHLGTKCPTPAHDANKDGFVDHAEAMKVAKQVMLPLDGNLSTQLDGQNGYPKGNYSYFQKASLSALMSDLTAADANTEDHIVKLKSGANLNLEGKVILVHGAAANRALPATVATLPGQTAQASIPIACAVIERLPSTGTASN